MKYYHSDMTRYVELTVPNDMVIGVAMSGGTDSSLLCYLLAKTAVLENSNSSIYPYHIDYDGKVPAARNVEMIIHLISELTGFTNFKPTWSWSVYEAHRKQPDKDIVGTVADSLLRRNKVFDKFYTGLTKNPDITLVPELAENRMDLRDNALDWLDEWRTMPFKELDKSFVADLYTQFNLRDNLLPLTISCDGLIENVNPATNRCGKCWWCKEREWAFGKGV